MKVSPSALQLSALFTPADSEGWEFKSQECQKARVYTHTLLSKSVGTNLNQVKATFYLVAKLLLTVTGFSVPILMED